MTPLPIALSHWQNGQRWPAAILNGQAHEGMKGRQLRSPSDQQSLGELDFSLPQLVGQVIQAAGQAQLAWSSTPPPLRGEIVRKIGENVRRHKEALAQIITLESGKIRAEALGEVQEWIDICDFATGLSRQLYGLTIASERPSHRMMEQWHPLGVVGVISAFNFPVAVWAWNAMIGLVCGNSLVWKPSEKTPLSALAAIHLCHQVLAAEKLPLDLCSLINGDATTGNALAEHRQVALVSATGSVRMGKRVAEVVARRLGRSLLELGGNNAMIVTPSANLELAIRAITFSAVGTCGQRCTTLRRLIVHESLYETLLARLVKTYQQLPIGKPEAEGTLVGPLIDEPAAQQMQSALQAIVREGGKVRYGGTIHSQLGPNYVVPALVDVPGNLPTVHQETFAPILYCMRYQNLPEAIQLQNQVPQGLSSSIITQDIQEAECFMSATGSDCGIANVNIGTSGAEIGGAFGGEKETGGGRESGSDSWKQYMRRTTNTINYGSELPLSQGIQFNL